MIATGRGNGSRPHVALAYMAGGVLCLAALDAVTKWLTVGYDTWQLIWLTRIVAITVAIGIGYHETGRLAYFHTNLWRFHAFRGLLSVATGWCFYEALRTMPLADAVAIGFAAPLFVTILSGPLLGESVGRQRWIAVVVGFAGVSVALWPNLQATPSVGQGLGPFLALAAALAYALILLTLRRVSGREPSHVILFYSQLLPFAIAAPMALLNWRTPTIIDSFLFLLQGSLGTAGGLLMIRAFARGEASLLAPVEYTALVWSIIFGLLLFDQFPGPMVLIGAAIIIGAGIYLARHETSAR